MKKSVKLLVHISFWLVIYFTIYMIYRTLLISPFPPHGYHPLWNFEALSFLTIIGIAIPFYVIYFSIKKITGKDKRYLWYLLILIFLIAYPFFTSSFLDDFETIDVANYTNSFILYFFFALIGGLFRIFFNWIEQGKIKDNIEKQNLKSELALLKFQINPHFLFNSLNNIDSLIQEDSQKASLALNKLSELMRYMIYDSEYEQVPLNKEIEYIENYIALQKLRTLNEQNIIFEINGSNNNILIAPMIFITFVENAFKHSSLKSKENKILIKLLISDDLIEFDCINNLSNNPIEKDKSSGIGLNIIKKRLELIYVNNYDLNIDESDNKFSVSLKIKLNAN